MNWMTKRLPLAALACVALLSVSACQMRATEKQMEVVELRHEIRQHFINPCILATAEKLRKDPGGGFYDMPTEQIAYHLKTRFWKRYNKIESDVVRLVHGKDATTRQQAYRESRASCETAMLQ